MVDKVPFTSLIAGNQNANYSSNSVVLSAPNGKVVVNSNIYIDGEGRVGIGTTIPAARLHVPGKAIVGTLNHSPSQITSISTASNPNNNDGFGESVSISGLGTVMVVGAWLYDGGGTDRGAVYTYDWNGSQWVQRGSVLTPADAADNDSFGRSVSLNEDGTVLAVGAYLWEGASGTNRGTVYIFDWTNGAWVQRGNPLEAPDAADNDYFGDSVALSSDATRLAIGAGNWEGATGTNRGGVYTYTWDGFVWSVSGSVLEASDAADNDIFGTSCALNNDGTVLAVGAIYWEGATGSNRGAVYIYDWVSSAWVQRGNPLEAADAANNDYFGRSVALSHDGYVMAVGAQAWEGTTGTNTGGVYIYDYSGNTWVQRGDVLVSLDAANNDYFGTSVGFNHSGSILVVGAGSWEGATGADQGAVYTYTLTGEIPGLGKVTTGAGWIDEGNLIARTGGTDTVTITKTGNVGIGTSSTVHKFSIHNGNLQINTVGYGIVFPDGSVQTTAPVATPPGGTTGAVQYNSGSSTFAGDADKLSLNTNGNVGIGTSNANVSLQIEATDAMKIPTGTTSERPAGETGQVRYNTTKNTVECYNGSDWTVVGGAQGGAFYLNSTTITDDYTVPVGFNAGSFGPIIIASGVTVTVSSGSTWTIIS